MIKKIFTVTVLCFTVGLMAQEKTTTDATQAVKEQTQDVQNADNSLKTSTQARERGQRNQKRMRDGSHHQNMKGQKGKKGQRNRGNMTEEQRAERLDRRMGAIDQKYDERVKKIENDTSLSKKEKEAKLNLLRQLHEEDKAAVRERHNSMQRNMNTQQ